MPELLNSDAELFNSGVSPSPPTTEDQDVSDQDLPGSSRDLDIDSKPASSVYLDCEDSTERAMEESSDKLEDALNDLPAMETKNIKTQEIRTESPESDVTSKTDQDGLKKDESDTSSIDGIDNDKDIDGQNAAEFKGSESNKSNSDLMDEKQSEDTESPNSNDQNEQECSGDEHDGQQRRDGEVCNWTDQSYSGSEYTDEESGSCSENRQRGDGEDLSQETETENSKKAKETEEDVRNPQYIPKKGNFYEHDNRTCSESETDGDTAKKENSSRPEHSRQKKSRNIPDQWEHDLYKEEEQMPKSSTELIQTYGYNIRSEDGPPKSRHHRKYGRGPNKYTKPADGEEPRRRRSSRNDRSHSRQTSGNEPKNPIEHSQSSINEPSDPLEHDQESVNETSTPVEHDQTSVTEPSNPTEHIPPLMAENIRPPAVIIENRSSASRTGPRNYVPEHSRLRVDNPYQSSERYQSNRFTSNYEHRGGFRHANEFQRNQYSESCRSGNYRGHGYTGSGYAGENYQDSSQYSNGRPGRGRSAHYQKFGQSRNSGPSNQKVEGSEVRKTSSANGSEIVAPGAVPAFGPSLTFVPTPGSASAVRQPPPSTRGSKRYSQQTQRPLPEFNNDNLRIQARPQPRPVRPAGKLENADLSRLVTAPIPDRASVYVSPPQMQSIPSNSVHQIFIPAATSNFTNQPATNTVGGANHVQLVAFMPPMQGQPVMGTQPSTPQPSSYSAPYPPSAPQQQQSIVNYSSQQSPVMMGYPAGQPQSFMAFPTTPQPPPLLAYQQPPINYANGNRLSAPSLIGYQPTAPIRPPTPIVHYEPDGYPMATTQPVPLGPIPPTLVTLASTPTTKQELYQSRGGVTYYSTRTQVNGRTPPTPRVKTAIPIVPPPNNEPSEQT